MNKVAIIMGSDSDLPVVSKAFDVLTEYGVKFEVHVFSAHRTPEVARDFALKARDNGFGVIIAAAGNDGRRNSVNYPGRYPEVICVSAYDKNGKPASFNSTGPEVGFSAPGVDIYSTWLDQKYATLSGTSMATPFMAGLVALLISKHIKQELETGKNDCKTVEQIREHLLKYADKKGVTGHDENWGYGVINPEKLINETDTETTPTVVTPQNKISFWNKIKNWFREIFG